MKHASERRRPTTAFSWATATALLALVVTSPPPVAAQAVADVEPATLQPAAPSEVGMSAAGLERLGAAMREMVAAGELAGIVLMVARDGRIVHRQTDGHQDLDAGTPLREDTVFRIYSMTKPIAGVALMTLWEDGKFALDDPVEKYVPELAGLKVAAGVGEDGPVLEDAAHPMTIRELMTHTAGLTYGLFSRSQVDQLYQEAGVLDRDQTLEQMVAKLAKIPLRQQPGSVWHYSVAVDVQGYLVEVLSGLRFGEYLEREIFQPLGMVDTAFWVDEARATRFTRMYAQGTDGTLEAQPQGEYLTPPAFESGGGGLVSTAMDYLRFAQMLANDGELDGVRILKPETVELMRTNQLPEHIEEISPFYRGNLFGLDFALVADPNPATDHPLAKGEYWWYGIGGTFFGIHPTQDLVVVGMLQNFGGAAARKARLTAKRLAYEAIEEVREP